MGKHSQPSNTERDTQTFDIRVQNIDEHASATDFANGAVGMKDALPKTSKRVHHYNPFAKKSIVDKAQTSFGSAHSYTQRKRPRTSIRPSSYVSKSSGTKGESTFEKQGFFKRNMSNILIGLGIILMLAGVGYWGYSQWCYYMQAQTNANLAKYATIPSQNQETIAEDTSNAPQVDWAGLKAINPEVVGWIQVPNTLINYPVYQANNNEKYLRHNAEGNWTIGGQIFMDTENTAPGLVEQQSILYGHHLKDGSMFYHFFLLNEQKNFDDMKCIWYVTEKAAYKLRPLFYYYTHPDDEEVRRFQFASQDEFHAYLQERLSKAITKLEDADKIIPHLTRVMTMSTCNYEPGYGRSETVCALESEVALAKN